ncbi:MAG: hypothetical protein NZL98_06365 [Anaerolineales bacterium]|nr:hypothetical protein [Anaerolineales bacterium]MDW8226883.1 hypothetical protein [Anaerolineales bacterium]
MPLFFKKKPQGNFPRNLAARHNARLRARQATLKPPPVAKQPSPSTAVATSSPPAASPSPQEQAVATPPGQRLKAILKAGEKAPPAKLPWRYRLVPTCTRLRHAAWDVAAVISLTVNAILLGVILVLVTQLQQLKQTVNGLMGGLYDNFVRMDNSVISTTIVIEDLTIPIDFTLPVVQDEIYVTLTRDVTIRNALVGILSLPTTVTLPKGTRLAISLGMDVPVKTEVSVDLQVPVNIQLSRAIPADPNVPNLHQAFLGLQNTIGPFYCLFEPDAQDYTGVYLCREGEYIPRLP